MVPPATRTRHVLFSASCSALPAKYTSLRLHTVIFSSYCPLSLLLTVLCLSVSLLVVDVVCLIGCGCCTVVGYYTVPLVWVIVAVCAPLAWPISVLLDKVSCAPVTGLESLSCAQCIPWYVALNDALFRRSAKKWGKFTPGTCSKFCSSNTPMS